MARIHAHAMNELKPMHCLDVGLVCKMYMAAAEDSQVIEWFVDLCGCDAAV